MVMLTAVSFSFLSGAPDGHGEDGEGDGCQHDADAG